MIVRGEAKNTGAVPMHRVRAVLRSPDPLLDGKEITFGTIAPRKSRVGEVAIEIPPGAPSGAELVSATASCDESTNCGSADFVARIEGRPHPVFSVSYETADGSVAPNAGARPRRQLVVKIRNIGTGSGKDVYASLRNAPGQDDVLIDAGRFRRQHLDRGQTVTHAFLYEDALDNREEPYRFDLTVGEASAAGLTTHRISFQGGGAGAAAGHVTPPIVTASAPLVVPSFSVRVSGEASSEGGLRDVFMTVQNLGSPRPPQKVFYLPSAGSGTHFPFAADVPVEKGSNLIRVTARGADGVATTISLSVLMTRSPIE
jgi:hypothetical protein